MVHWVQISMISASLWLMRITVMPAWVSLRSKANRLSTSPGVKTAVGSSRIRIFTSRYNALMISTRCCCPTVRSPTRA